MAQTKKLNNDQRLKVQQILSQDLRAIQDMALQCVIRNIVFGDAAEVNWDKVAAYMKQHMPETKRQIA